MGPCVTATKPSILAGIYCGPIGAPNGMGNVVVVVDVMHDKRNCFGCF